jgi:hypothetical protein
MSDSRNSQDLDLRGRLRGQLGADAVVADYIHELSDRHAGSEDREGKDGAIAADAPTQSPLDG